MGNNLKQAEKKDTDAPSEASSSSSYAVVAQLRPSCKGLGLGMQLDSCDAAQLTISVSPKSPPPFGDGSGSTNSSVQDRLFLVPWCNAYISTAYNLGDEQARAREY